MKAIFLIIINNLIKNKERSILTAVGVLFAVAITITLLSAAEGIYSYINNNALNRGADIYITKKDSTPIMLGPLGFINIYTNISNINKDKIQENPLVYTTAYFSRIIVHFKEDLIMIIGFPQDKLEVFFPNLKLYKGNLYNNDNEIAIGYFLSKLYNLNIGDTINISDKTLTITGIFKPTNGYDDYFIFTNFNTLKNLNEDIYPQELWVKLNSNKLEYIKALKNYIKENFNNYKAYSKEEVIFKSIDFAKMVKMLQFSIALIGILIALTATTNTMLISVFERLDEFGTLMALGMERKSIFISVLLEGIFLTFAGGFIGIIFGFIGAGIFNEVLNALFQFTFPLTLVDLSLVMQAIFIAILLGIISSILPAIIASKVDFITSLRKEN